MQNVTDVDIQVILDDIKGNEETLRSIKQDRHYYERNRRFLNERAALAGGEEYLQLSERSQLENISQKLKDFEEEYQDVQKKLDDLRSELQNAKEYNQLIERLDEAKKQSKFELINPIANRLKTLRPLESATLDQELIRFNWHLALETSPENYEVCKIAWERVEKTCFELGSEDDLQAARNQLAELFEKRGNILRIQGAISSEATHYYRQAYEKYAQNGDILGQSRIVGELHRLYENNIDDDGPILVLSYYCELIEQWWNFEKFNEAQHYYNQALRICMLFNDNTKRAHWEQQLAKANKLDDLASIDVEVIE